MICNALFYVNVNVAGPKLVNFHFPSVPESISKFLTFHGTRKASIVTVVLFTVL